MLILRGHTSAGIRRRLEEADKKSAYEADKENGKVMKVESYTYL